MGALCPLYVMGKLQVDRVPSAMQSDILLLLLFIMMYIGCVHCPVHCVYCVLYVLPCPAPPSIHYKANTGGVSPHMNTKAPNLKCFCCAHVSGAPWYTIVDTSNCVL